ncbi:hypothetical protein FOA43_000542 [Brettanomyces nanus]|uniref:Uncharacterized protein n=1 Tax=Eeniella nana TaxID=13502 RepID=A0A875RYV4_EENNA|nr:uncharacterized protein FOA43_000542 [Brettanomyces nanus]QPG73235.1 hypothetical protein FOA43_000542 [Brettanomyces nanus]
MASTLDKADSKRSLMAGTEVSKFLDLVLTSSGSGLDTKSDRLVQARKRSMPRFRDRFNHASTMSLALNKTPELRALQFDSFVSLSDILTSHKTGIPLTGINHDSDDEKENDENRDAIEDGSSRLLLDKVTHFVPLRMFHLKNSDGGEEDPSLNVGRELILAVDNLPRSLVASVSVVESLLVYVITEVGLGYKVSIKDKPENRIQIVPEFRWSFLDNEYVAESKMVFIEFEDILALYLFKMILESLGGQFESVVLSVKKEIVPALKKLKESISIEIDSEDTSSETKQNIARLIKCSDIRYKLRGEREMVNEKEYVSQYRVDPSDLSDVPSYMVDSVRQNVIDFRLQVIQLEKKEREKRQLEDKRKTKLKLRQLFNELNNQSAKDQGDKMEVDELENNLEDEDNENENDDDLDDEEYEKKVQAEKKQRLEREYNKELQLSQKKEAKRKQLYERFINEVEHHVYMSKVIPKSREKFLKSFVSNVHDSDNTIDRNHEYYTRHNNYLKYRSKPKEKEEEEDDKDRKEENNDRATSSEANKFIASFETTREKPVKISFKKGRKKVELAGLTTGQLEKVRIKAEGLVEKYIGIKEDSLIHFMVQFMEKNFGKGKGSVEYSDFVHELEETLDEEASTVAEILYDYVDSL